MTAGLPRTDPATRPFASYRVAGDQVWLFGPSHGPDLRQPLFRVHCLANLGGLLAVAALNHYPPDLLFGIFLEVAARVLHLSEQRNDTRAGQARLEERAAEKRAWIAWHPAGQGQVRGLDLASWRSADSWRPFAVAGEVGGSAAGDPAAHLLRVRGGAC